MHAMVWCLPKFHQLLHDLLFWLDLCDPTPFFSVQLAAKYVAENRQLFVVLAYSSLLIASGADSEKID